MSGEPSINLLAVTVVVTSLFVLKFNIYKKWPIHALETIFYVNLILLSSGKFYFLKVERASHNILAYISTSVSIIMLFCVLAYHIVSNTPIKNWVNRKKTSGMTRLNNENLTTHLLEEESEFSSPQQVTFSVVEITKPTLSNYASVT